MNARAGQPRIAAETPSYIVVDKPHNLHTAPLHAGEDGTLFGWCAHVYPEILTVRGRKPVEGGLLHRLDYETAGLVLIARTQSAYDFLAAEQEAGRFEKDYTAGTRPQPAGSRTVWNTEIHPALISALIPRLIESGFRHYGPGRKLVKPEPHCLRTERRYVTRILDVDSKEGGGLVVFRIRLTRGFRHQIRAHLAWIGHPINNDTRYGGANTGGPLELTASRLAFTDPETGTPTVWVK